MKKSALGLLLALSLVTLSATARPETYSDGATIPTEPAQAVTLPTAPPPAAQPPIWTIYVPLVTR